MPKVQAALELYHILSESNTDLRQPVGLEMQLLKDEALDSEVGQSMLQLLQVSLAPSPLPCLDLCPIRQQPALQLATLLGFLGLSIKGIYMAALAELCLANSVVIAGNAFSPCDEHFCEHCITLERNTHYRNMYDCKLPSWTLRCVASCGCCYC